MKEKAMKPTTIVLILVLALLSISCKDNVLVLSPKSQQSSGTVFVKLASTPATITHVTAHLTRSGFHELQLSMIISDSSTGATGSLEDVVVGIWHLKVDALDDSNIVRYTGETDVEVRPGETSQADLELFPTSGRIEIHVTWGSNSLNSGLMLHMPFDGTLADYSGHDNNGISSHAAYTADRFGTPGKAYKFNGIDNFITIGNSPSLTPDRAVSIAFWFRIDSVAWNVSQIISKTVGDVENTREYAVELKANDDYPYFKLWAAATDGGTDELDAGHSLRHQWHHFVGVVDRTGGQSMNMYIDGALVGELPDDSHGFVVNSHPLYIGAGEGVWESTSVPDLTLDDLRIYSRALSPAEVRSLYNVN
jgi:hypothetical protein